MRVQFYVYSDESDIYDFPDTISEDELEDAAAKWASDNVPVGYEIIDEDEE